MSHSQLRRQRSLERITQFPDHLTKTLCLYTKRWGQYRYRYRFSTAHIFQNGRHWTSVRVSSNQAASSSPRQHSLYRKISAETSITKSSTLSFGESKRHWPFQSPTIEPEHPNSEEVMRTRSACIVFPVRYVAMITTIYRLW